MKRHLLAAVLFAAAVSPAAAYTTYLKAEEAWPEGANIEVEASFANDFFTPQVAVQADFALVLPNGSTRQFENINIGNDATLIGIGLPGAGTYRVTTGEQLGRVTTLVGVNGQWQQLGEGQTAPEGAQTTTLQTVNVADTYVTRGQASPVTAPTGQLALRPITHPNQALASQPFQVEVRFNGAPMPNTAVVLYSEGDLDTDLDTYAVTDASGVATFTLTGAGSYVVAARHRAEAPAGSEAAVRSYTTTLTFEALDAIPAGYDVQAREEERVREERRARRQPNLTLRQRRGG